VSRSSIGGTTRPSRLRETAATAAVSAGSSQRAGSANKIAAPAPRAKPASSVPLKIKNRPVAGLAGDRVVESKVFVT